MGKVLNLTTEQEALFPKYMDRWLQNAAGETSHREASSAIVNLYKRMELKKPSIIHFSSPYSSILASFLLCSQLGSQLYSQLGSQLCSQLDSQLCSQLHSQLHSQLCSQLRSQLHSQLDSQLGSQLCSQLDSQLYSQLGSQLGSQLHSQLCSHYIVVWWRVWACYYEYAQYIGVDFDKGGYDLFVNFVRHIHSCSPYKNVFIYSDKPIECHWKGTQLHNEHGMAVKYSDGWGWYALNGVMMKPEYVLTPPDKIEPEVVLKEENVDVRRELLRKVGIDRMCKLGEVKDKNNGYELIDMGKLFKGTRITYAPYLYMKNPSMADTYHLEGVSPECKTVQEAINWRAGNIEIRWTPSMLS